MVRGIREDYKHDSFIMRGHMLKELMALQSQVSKLLSQGPTVGFHVLL